MIVAGVAIAATLAGAGCAPLTSAYPDMSACRPDHGTVDCTIR